MRAGGRKIGRCRLAVIRTTTLRLPVLAAPLHPLPVPSFPSCSPCASSASPPPFLLRPFCFPFPKSANRQRPRGSVSRLIKRRKLANEISIRLRNTRVGVVSSPSPFPSPPSACPPFFLSLCRLISRIPVPSSVRSLPLT